MVVSSIQASLIYYEVRAMHSSSDRAVGKNRIFLIPELFDAKDSLV